MTSRNRVWDWRQDAKNICSGMDGDDLKRRIVTGRKSRRTGSLVSLPCSFVCCSYLGRPGYHHLGVMLANGKDGLMVLQEGNARTSVYGKAYW